MSSPVELFPYFIAVHFHGILWIFYNNFAYFFILQHIMFLILVHLAIFSTQNEVSLPNLDSFSRNFLGEKCRGNVRVCLRKVNKVRDFTALRHL